MFGETVNHKSEDPHEMVMDAEQMRQQRFTITAHIKVDIYSKFNVIYLGLTLKGWLIINPFIWETYLCEWNGFSLKYTKFCKSNLNGKYDIFSLDDSLVFLQTYF